ncbi:MAG: polysaccharide pyruvyl transferase family protein [Bacilli bacterium]|nr:polysaccharide pyruvyl transferase family protein [Bacilli bacterium]
MTVGILTWYKSLNHGAILQAYASQQFLKENNCDSLLLDYDRNINIMESNYEKFKRRLSYMNISHLLMKTKQKNWNKEKKILFEKFINSNMNVGMKYYEYDNIDKVMIGSDMVFDFYEGYNPFMYGKNVNSKYIFSYAACFGYTTPKSFEKFEKNEEIISLIKKMNGIGYRDNNTNDILINNCNINSAIKNIDPVLLYGFEKEKKIWNNNGWKNKKYILIYSYQSNLNKKNEYKYIQKIAKEKNLELISVGYYHPWCDKNINADPKEFVELFSNAKYVVTDTFHGLVFSIIMNKQFSIIVRNNSFKILDLLNDLNIKFNNNESIEKKIERMCNNEIDYSIINKQLNKLKENSKEYLLNQIKE